MRRSHGAFALRGALILALAATASASPPAAAQRCAGTLEYLIRNEYGEFISASDVAVECRGAEYTRPRYRARWTEAADDDAGREAEAELAALLFHTGCGKPLIEMRLEYNGATMSLRIKNCPMEMNFYVDSPPFQGGAFELDLRPAAAPDVSDESDMGSIARWFPGVNLLSAEAKEADPFLRQFKDHAVVSAGEWRKLEK